MSKTWRDVASPVIAGVLQKTKGCEESIIKKALYDAYPFGERQYHPYKIWLDEIRVQRGKRKFNFKQQPIDPNQNKLF